MVPFNDTKNCMLLLMKNEYGVLKAEDRLKHLIPIAKIGIFICYDVEFPELSLLDEHMEILLFHS